jgi:hypothetical protein
MYTTSFKTVVIICYFVTHTHTHTPHSTDLLKPHFYKIRRLRAGND